MWNCINPRVLNDILSEQSVREGAFMPSGVNYDFAPLVSDPQNQFYTTPKNDGGYVLLGKGKGVYELHTLAKKSARGMPMWRLAKAMFKRMFEVLEARCIVSFVPLGQDHVLRWALAFGFKTQGFGIINAPEGGTIKVQHIILTKSDYIAQGN